MLVRWLSSCFFASLLLGGHTPNPADAANCDLGIVLAFDGSKSMDKTEFDLQLRGSAEALLDPRVQNAILSDGALVAMSALEWSSKTRQSSVAGWTLLHTKDDIERFASSILQHRRGSGEGSAGSSADLETAYTGIGSAIQFAMRGTVKGPRCFRTIIDVSSDGYNNDGLTPKLIYRTEQYGLVTVNALVIGGKTDLALWRYFVRNVIYGPDAFAIATEGLHDYSEAIREKLIRELAPVTAISSSENFDQQQKLFSNRTTPVKALLQSPRLVVTVLSAVRVTAATSGTRRRRCKVHNEVSICLLSSTAHYAVAPDDAKAAVRNHLMSDMLPEDRYNQLSWIYGGNGLSN
jgi:hypothetical protein